MSPILLETRRGYNPCACHNDLGQRVRNISMALALLVMLAPPMLPSALAQAYCYITEVKYEVVSNAVQVEVKADGILKWEWGFPEWEAQEKRQLISVRFPNARLRLEERYIEVHQHPVSTIVFYTPQDATGGTGVVMEVALSERSRFKGTISTDERSFVLTVDSPLRVENAGAEKKKKEEDKKKEEVLTVDVSNGLVTVHALRADIHKVIAQIAQKTGLSVTLDDAVSHQVNINLNRMRPLDVIRAIATGYGLALSTVGDVHMLSEGVPKDLTTYNRSGTASFPMDYLRAEDAKELLPAFLTQYVHFNEEQNAVVATAPSQMLDKIRRDLESVDQPPPLIMVEVVAVEITDTGQEERGLSWLYSTHDRAFGTNSSTGAVSYEAVEAGGLTGGVVANTARLAATLRALQSQGRARIRSNPRIAALNGKEAEIFIGQDRFILVQYNFGGATQERIEAVPVGVKLEVQPWTGGNGEITTRVEVAVSNISELDPKTGLPLLSTRKATSTIRTRDGETIVIGGLRQKQKEVTRTKMPVLGDIPILGPALFQGKSESSVETELVILVTPRILNLDGDLLDASQGELRRRLLEPGDCGYEDDKACPPVQEPIKEKTAATVGTW